MKAFLRRPFSSCVFLAPIGAFCLTNVAFAQPAVPTAPVVSDVQSPAGSTPGLQREGVIGIIINGRNVDVNPAPILKNGSVFVPLRGVLENLGAKVTYDATASRIDILQNGKRYSLQVGETAVAVENSAATLSSAPFLSGGRAFVPLRDLAELFGYKVQWLAATQIVSIVDPATGSTPGPIADHEARLKNAGRFGVTVDFYDANPNDVEPLLDAVKNSGATLIKFRFDWNALEPRQGGAFQWPIFDRIVAGARDRNLTIVGILGNTTKWATIYPRSENPNEWRNSPPKTALLPAWDNYVRRVVGRYKNDVHAWQIWENPATQNFRSVAKDYRIVARRAVDAARSSDPQAILFAGEPGGVNLGFIEELRRNGLLPHLNGVAVYPTSQWQPGVEAGAEEMVPQLSALYNDPQNRNKDYWVNGLSRLSLEPGDWQGPAADSIFNTKDIELRKKLAQEFSPAAQADYLVRAMTLALATGTEKVFWGDLRDDSKYEPVNPVNSYYGGGLLKRDGTQRPAFAAFSNLTKLLDGKQYMGAVASGPRAVVLIFGNEKDALAVAWAAPREDTPTRLTFDPSRDPGLPGAIHLVTNTDSQVLDSTGKRIGESSGQIDLSSRPVWITSLSFRVPQQLRDTFKNKQLQEISSREIVAPDQQTLRAVFAPGKEGEENGLYWRKYLGFRGAANEFVKTEGSVGLKTTYSRDVMNPAAGNPSIYLDVANNYLFFARGAAVRVTVEVRRPVANEGPFAPKGGFNLMYDSPTGFRSTPWQIVEGGDGWATFVIDIPDASFANRDGFDLLINAWGSRQDLVFRSVTLERLGARVANAGVADTGSTPGATAAPAGDN
jgi:hypothetical protein